MKKKLFTIVAFVALAMGFFCLNQFNKSSNSIISGNIEALTSSGDGVRMVVHGDYEYDKRSSDMDFVKLQPRENHYDENGNWYPWGGFCDIDHAGWDDDYCIDIEVWG